MQKNRNKAYLALILASLFAGALLPVGKYALGHVDLLELLFVRFAFGLMLALPLFAWQYRLHRPLIRDILLLVGVAFFGTLGMLVFYFGLTHTDSLQASLTASLSGVIVTLMGILLLREHESRREWLGLSLAVIGSLMIVALPLLTQSTGVTILIFGNMIVLGAVLMRSLQAVLIKKYFTDMPQLLISSMAILTGALTVGILMFLRPEPIDIQRLLRPGVLLSGVYLAVFGSVIASSLSYFGYKYIDASEAVLFDYLKPLSYLPLSILWLSESLIVSQVFGLLVIVLGVIIAEKRAPSKEVIHVHHH